MNRITEMKLKLYIVSLLLVQVVFCTAVKAQELKLNLAESLEQQFDYKSAAEVYLDVLKKHPANYKALTGGARAFRNLQEDAQAETLLVKLDSLKLASPEDLLLLADAYKSTQKYDKAFEIYQKYSLLNPGNELVRKYLADENWATKINRDSSLFKLKNSTINSKYSDFAPAFYEDKMMFSSSRGDKNIKTRSYNWNDQSYLNLYVAELTADSNLINPKPTDELFNSRYHEGAATYHKPSKTLYITRNNYLRGVKNKDDEGYLNLAIYFAVRINGEFTELIPFPFNSEEYSVGHPSVAEDGSAIYFSSDMPGGHGGTDIYVSEWTDGEWAKPRNLGPKVNTSGDEMFPFIHDSGILYFSSANHVGLGGLDVHSIDLQNEAAQVQNVGYPINSSYDDFSIILDKRGKEGFFSSNRPDGIGDDDIYKFFIHKPKFITISGHLIDEETENPVPNGSVLIKDRNNPTKIEIVATSDETGAYTFTLPYQDYYELRATKKGFFEAEKTVHSSPTTSFIDNVDFRLSKYDFLAKGNVLNAEDLTPMKGAAVTLYDGSGEVISKKITTDDGYYSFGLYSGKEYRITCEMENHALQSVNYDTRNAQSKVFEHDFKMFKLEVGVVVQLDNIYYDYGKANIRPDAALELDKLVSILEENPSMKIELSSHTDSRGSAPYNLNLSKRRAKSAVEYIVSKGISSSRIKSRGYGETKPLNKCRDGVQCTEEEYQLNRRTEFTILDI